MAASTQIGLSREIYGAYTQTSYHGEHILFIAIAALLVGLLVGAQVAGVWGEWTEMMVSTPGLSAICSRVRPREIAIMSMPSSARSRPIAVQWNTLSE